MDHRHKIKSWEETRRIVETLRAEGKRIVFTNGCFDLIHLGHLRYLTEARSLGDFLIVGLNSDESVRRIKDKTRPLNPEDQRMEVMAGLEVVGGVVLFEQDTPLELIQTLEPDVLVKGGDWPVDRIVGREVVEGRGGLVLSIPLTPGISTSGIIDRILERYRPKGF